MDFLTRGSEYLARYPDFRLVGRDQDSKRLISILMRNYASSVILVGAGGVGCTSLCIGIQAAKRDPTIPFDILGKRLSWLDVDGLFSSGESDRINHTFHRIIARLTQRDNSVLLVEDTRDFIEACRNNGTMYLINALLVAVRSKNIQVIFETRDDDLDQVLKCHSDMRELFTILPLDEPAGEALFQIVTAAAAILGKHHGIPVTPEAIITAIEFSNRHTRDTGLSRAQPERSITLIDRALSAYRLDAHRNPPGLDPREWQAKQDEMRHLNLEQRDGEEQLNEFEDQLDQLTKHSEQIDGGRSSPFSNIETPETAALRGKIKTMNTEITRIKGRLGMITSEINADLALNRAMVLTEFSEISGIPIDKLDQNERAKLRGIDEVLKRRIFGQNPVVLQVSNGIRVARVGKRSKDKPLPYLFLGPSGVGKSEMAKSLAEALYDDDNTLVRFDMSDYMEKHAVAKMIGAPPGYEGFEAGGILTNLVRRNSNRVFLFDEIEKAHPDVFNIFLAALDAGVITDNLGRLCRFTDATMIFTTNIGQPHFLDENMSDTEAETAAITELGTVYRSEFLNRFNGRENIICFKKLGLDSIERIVQREITNIDTVYGEKGVHVIATSEVITAFCLDKYNPRFGARGLPGFINANLEPHIVNTILEDRPGQRTVKVRYDEYTKKFNIEIIQDHD